MERTVLRVPNHIRERNDEIGSIKFEIMSLKNDYPDSEQIRQSIQVLEEKLQKLTAVQLATDQAFNQQFLSDCSPQKVHTPSLESLHK